jgi:hypothetical protein
MAHQDPDDILVALFKVLPVLNNAKTLKEGRKIYDDVEHVEIRAPGSKDVKVFPATAVSHWATSPYDGEQSQITYAERFRRQYQQFKALGTQTKSGTPLSEVAFLSAGKQAELRAQNIYTIEALAAIEGAELKNLGQGGRELKNQAVEYLEESKRGAPNLQMAAELEALRARNAILEEDLALKKANEAKISGEFDAMSDVEIREYIRINTGNAPQGQPARKTLIRMAMECRPDKAA